MIEKLQTKYRIKTREQKTMTESETFFSNVDIPKLPENQPKRCEEYLTRKNLYNFLKSMQSDKYPGNDGLKKEIYENFWNELKKIFEDSVPDANKKGNLSTSQREAIIQIIEKKG